MGITMIIGIIISTLIAFIIYPLFPSSRFILIGTAMYLHNEVSIGLLVGDWAVGGLVEKGIHLLDPYLSGIKPEDQVNAIGDYKLIKMFSLVGTAAFTCFINTPPIEGPWLKWVSIGVIIMVVTLILIVYDWSINLIIAIGLCSAAAFLCSRSSALSPMAAIFCAVYTFGELLFPSHRRNWEGSNDSVDQGVIWLTGLASSMLIGMPNNTLLSKEGMTQRAAYYQHVISSAVSESLSLTFAFVGIGSRDAFSTNLDMLGVLDNDINKLVICGTALVLLGAINIKQPIQSLSFRWVNLGLAALGIIINGGYAAIPLMIIGAFIALLVRKEKDIFSMVVIPCITAPLLMVS